MAYGYSVCFGLPGNGGDVGSEDSFPHKLHLARMAGSGMVYVEETGVVFEFSLWLLVTILLVSYDLLSSPSGFLLRCAWGLATLGLV